jgi:hypothetical protein
MSTLNFSDGVSIDTKGNLRLLHLRDGWYVVGEGHLIPVNDIEEGADIINSMLGDLTEE